MKIIQHQDSLHVQTDIDFCVENYGYLVSVMDLMFRYEHMFFKPVNGKFYVRLINGKIK